MTGTSLTTAFVPLPGGGTAVYNASGLAYYRHADWLGSSRLASTQSRGLDSSTAYAPFGEQYAASGTADPSFTGQNSDTVPSLYDFTFRRLSPSQGRWISPDPSGLAAVDPTNPQTWNRYAYVANNPLSYIDPYGLNLAQPCSGSAQCNNGDTGNPLDPLDNGSSVFSAAANGTMFTTELESYNPFPSIQGPPDPIIYKGPDGNYYIDAPGGPIYLGPFQPLQASAFAPFLPITTHVTFYAYSVSTSNFAPNNGECDNACQLAHAFNKTGVYSLTSACFVPGFYAASAAGATGAVAVANAPEVYAATVGDYATWYGRAVSWLSRMVGKTPTGAGTAIAAAPRIVSQFCSSH